MKTPECVAATHSIIAGQLGQHDGEQVFIMGDFIRSVFSKVVLAVFCIALLTACGGSDNDISDQTASSEVSGSVGDGPITGATVEIFNVKGELVGTEISDDTASYKSSVKVRQSDYPMLLKVSDGIDLVTGDAPDFEMVSVMMRSSNSTANINPFSTLIVKMAQSMAGGVNADNINYATSVVMEKFSFGLDQNAIDNPVTTRVSSKNIAHIVKASEALGEMLRRTRDLISATGVPLTGDDIVNAIAADMADGFLDGTGATGSNPTIAAVANVVTGQILVEAMTNNLKVNGVIATVVIDQAISTTHPTVKSWQLSDSVLITSGLIKQAKLSVAAAQVVDSNTRLANLAADIDSISAQTSSTGASRILPVDASQWLDNAATNAATADAKNIITINLVASNSPDLAIRDTPPPVVEDPPIVEDPPPPVVEDPPPPVVEEGSVRVTDNLVAFYPFVERSGNMVRDLSGTASPMDLTITGAVNWYGAGNGVVMNGGRVGTAGPATELINTLRASNSSSFEVWAEPATIAQYGPSRMVSVGGGTSAQNFMLGQGGDDVEIRLMHTGKIKNSEPKVRTDRGVLDGSLVHLVHTYDGAVEHLYINGVQSDKTAVASGGYGNWDTSHVFSIGNEASLDRPYDGIIRMVAVYDRPLGAAEIQQNFAAGPTAGNVGGGAEGANNVPVISGKPAGSAATDEKYNFQPAASDADFDPLVFSITGKPAWASFDTDTGQLSGVPAINDVGTYGDIVISVTDSMDTVSLAAFSIKVSEPVQSGSFNLSWTAPTMRSDGTPLSMADISGYRIYYGEYEGDYRESVEIANGTVQSKTLTGIPVGTYYVVMSTYDVDGRESSFSNYVIKASQ